MLFGNIQEGKKTNKIFQLLMKLCDFMTYVLNSVHFFSCIELNIGPHDLQNGKVQGVSEPVCIYALLVGYTYNAGAQCEMRNAKCQKQNLRNLIGYIFYREITLFHKYLSALLSSFLSLNGRSSFTNAVLSLLCGSFCQKYMQVCAVEILKLNIQQMQTIFE